MKTKIWIIVIIMSVIISWDLSWHMSRSGLYPETGVITNIVETSFGIYEITFETANGNMFSFYTDDYDIYVGEIISVLMDDNGTEVVYNDTIIKHTYSGTPEMYILEE